MSTWATRIRALRLALGENRATFGARFARGGRAVEAWEQGLRAPDALVVEHLTRLERRLLQKSSEPQK